MPSAAPDQPITDPRRFAFPEAERDAVYRAIHSRRDVRLLREEPVADEVLVRVQAAGHRLPLRDVLRGERVDAVSELSDGSHPGRAQDVLLALQEPLPPDAPTW